MKEWFLSRTPRERVILAAGGAVGVVLIAWQLVWSPLSNGVERLGSQVDAQTRLLIDAQNAATIAPRDAGRPRTEQSLYVIADRTARSHGVADTFSQTTQQGATGLTVNFTAAPFDALLAWIVTLESEHAVTVESATFNATRQPGLVTGQVVLRRL